MALVAKAAVVSKQETAVAQIRQEATALAAAVRAALVRLNRHVAAGGGRDAVAAALGQDDAAQFTALVAKANAVLSACDLPTVAPPK